MKNATLRQLRIFAEVAKSLNFSRAAERLHLTAPAVSQQIKALEDHAGCLLFLRTGKQVQLSIQGEYLLVHVNRILAEVKSAENTLIGLQNLQTGTLTIGMVSTAEYFVPSLLAKFTREHPGIEIKLVVGNREQLSQWLEDYDVDVAVMGRAPQNTQCKAEPFAVHPHVFIAAAQHPAAQAPINPSLFQQYGFISREHGSGTRAAAKDFFDHQRIEPKIIMEMHSNETIKQAVMAGMGVSFVSKHTIALELKNNLLTILPLTGTPILRSWSIVTPEGKTLSPGAEAFRYFALEHGESHLETLF
ncbi:MAG: LysR family transcriptional regulator [Gammaproteobacteria bacterium]|nr:LysR family transcriptional regulator [Gammaproteobacteria bacterium]